MSSSQEAAEIAGFLSGSSYRLDHKVLICYRVDAVIVLYDFALTTGDEVRLFWNRKLTGASVLFLLNKWINVLYFLFAVVGYFKMSDVSEFGFGLSGVNFPLMGCQAGENMPINIVKTHRRITFMSDPGKLPRYQRDVRKSLAGVLFWDGLVYFLILALIDALHMTLTLLSISRLIIQDYLSYLTLFTVPLSSILMSRFMLHLQAAHCRATGMDSSQYSSAKRSSLVFKRNIGSLGTSISPEDFFTAPTEDDIEET
ncbi:hypothetical protein GSI_12552 [Ganoderma sinense ZZ0214-1]|uniref:DUF6533 domain-containing protein n=1 Tax=Ganoderma sinense ZZ0214-1 TaxID=1077348 RepID=A0A2G8RTJ3_9APHY|nr:hypothetical protein GSI_12552 [Ganoderma sinense ZZ0214-1]